LIRENIIRQAASLKDVRAGLRLQNDRINTGPTEYRA
jgi:hypothetical protein